ncbi:MAG: sigma-70 family RNA polymerase sigma factor [Dehalococcoidales bacterium]|nr:sigma-70 family RNA polymerase sigma factor [Dehalococcoidales bacterium]
MLFTLLINYSENNQQKLSQDAAAIFAAKYEQYLPKIFQYVSYRIGDKDMAQDLTSQVFEKAITKYDTYDEKKASFATWIYSIAYHTLIDHYRARGKKQDYIRQTMVEVTIDYTSPEEEVTHREDIKKLRLCLTRLKDSEREIVTMKFSGEMTNREIARILGLSESNVGVILCRAVRKLRDEFTGW